MRKISKDGLTAILKSERVSLRLIKSLRFTPDKVQYLECREMLAIDNRSSSEGVLIIDLDGFYVLPYILNKSLVDPSTGRLKSVICDFCCTWQKGGKGSFITFTRKNDKHSFTFITCEDLFCSLHIRNLTDEAMLSRTQLREDIDTGGRIARHKKRLLGILETIQQEPIKGV